MKLQIGPDGVLPGDQFVVPGGPYGGRRVEVVDVRRSRWGIYNMEVRLLGNVEVALEYSEMVNVERPPCPPHGEFGGKPYGGPGGEFP